MLLPSKNIKRRNEVIMNFKVLITILSLLAGSAQVCEAINKRSFGEFLEDELYQDEIERMQKKDREENPSKKQRVELPETEEVFSDQAPQLTSTTTSLINLLPPTPYINLESEKEDASGNLDSGIARLAPLVAQAQSISTTELKAIACGYCDQKFSQSKNRVNHIKSAHPGINPNTCYHCNKSFTFNGDLTRHIDSIHLGIKKYPCTYCNKSFTRDNSLTRHVNSWHPEVASSGQTPRLISITTPLISLLSAPTPNVELEKRDETTQASFDQEK